MKKAAIITIWDLENLGNRLQNYAVSKIVEKKGLIPKTIIIDEKKALTLKRRAKYLYWCFCFIITNGKKRIFEYRKQHFHDFTRKNIPSYVVHNQKELNEFDYVFIGSDQIWNSAFVEPSEYVYAQMVPPEKVICISPSFGVSSFDEEIEKKITPYLERLIHLNVREHSGAEIIKRLTGKDVPVFIDPTLMLTTEEWIQIEKKPRKIIKNKYILKYFLGKEPEESVKDTKKLADEYGYDVINVFDKNFPWQYATGPAEFLYLIHHAEMIFTDSFHSCVFSIQFKRPFWVYKRIGESMNSRMDTLFELLNMESRFVHDQNDPFRIDYSGVETALERERERVNSFLDNIISE
ncbi:polysaccharide pyruvyl transferase family protein [Butyrivibrio sp. AC2005]|uniref:polysaccharide pyruvyl transferase family protein n=1 Tax=Butyrivibrio sp. AC2005 TaxID=1280672 RepID=UPI0003FB43E1|nr:polysaccharide pyruvyl transferase family protein [Butyrivibrio sp. AC2005]